MCDIPMRNEPQRPKTNEANQWENCSLTPYAFLVDGGMEDEFYFELCSKFSKIFSRLCSQALK